MGLTTFLRTTVLGYRRPVAKYFFREHVSYFCETRGRLADTWSISVDNPVAHRCSRRTQIKCALPRTITSHLFTGHVWTFVKFLASS
jgi:hypothetical protein